MRGSERWIFIAALTAACSSSESRFVATPELGDARGAIAIIHEANGPRAITVDLSSDTDWRIETELDGDETIDVDLLLYDCGLETWLVDPEVGIAETGGRAIETPDRIFSWSSAGGDDWSTQDELPGRTAVLRFDFESPERCATLTTEASVSYPGTADPRLFITLDERRALVAGRDGNIYEVDMDGRVDDFWLNANADGHVYIGGFKDDDGTIYLISRGTGCVGRVDTSTISRVACVPLVNSPDPGTWMYIDGGMTPDGLELFVMSDNGETFVMPAGATAFEAITPMGSDSAGRKAGILRPRPGEVYFVGPLPLDVQRWADGTSTIEPVGLTPIDRANGLGLGEDGFPLLASNLGEIIRRGEDGWEQLGSSGVPQGRFIIAANGRTFIGGDSLIAEVAADGMSCEAAAIFSNELHRVGQTGPTTFAVAYRNMGVDPQVDFLRIDGPRRPSCR